MVRDGQWYTEASDELGLGFSLKIRDKLHEERSNFQTIAVYETETFGRLLTIDGLVMLTDRDNFIYHEMMTHPALFSHGRARRVVIIGGGDCGTLREVLKHATVESAMQIDIDERVTRVAEQYFPRLTESNADPRAELAFIDGVAWMRDAPANSVDVIIIDSTDPIGPAEGLFNAAFYEQCHHVLADDGLLVQQSESPLVHTTLIDDMHAAMQGAGFAAPQLVGFPQPSYPSGWWSASLAPARARALAEPPAAIPFHCDYYTADIHRAAFARPAFLARG
ncbi:polyamine aminopropyltransferase [Salinisphaera sp. Q1T1-3]|uniref:polyamine aminopropyltransferase n=1 Tax=Salinisphaera sp. Q1T1-3 TaxID=2321229 RepID=UPI000E708977|nr:polyamine aminopropyltransferase [Salinisphaera sp. Q1T1-3]RJS91401.1 polyamine aminopropyltransferase [Salinisphaera sp. Q1T1-3]